MHSQEALQAALDENPRLNVKLKEQQLEGFLEGVRSHSKMLQRVNRVPVQFTRKDAVISKGCAEMTTSPDYIEDHDLTPAQLVEVAERMFCTRLAADFEMLFIHGHVNCSGDGLRSKLLRALDGWTRQAQVANVSWVDASGAGFSRTLLDRIIEAARHDVAGKILMVPPAADYSLPEIAKFTDLPHLEVFFSPAMNPPIEGTLGHCFLVDPKTLAWCVHSVGMKAAAREDGSIKFLIETRVSVWVEDFKDLTVCSGMVMQDPWGSGIGEES